MGPDPAADDYGPTTYLGRSPLGISKGCVAAVLLNLREEITGARAAATH